MGIWLLLDDNLEYYFPNKCIVKSTQHEKYKAYMETESCSDEFLAKFGIKRRLQCIEEEIDESCDDIKEKKD